jgi:hypothetical protein
MANPADVDMKAIVSDSVNTNPAEAAGAAVPPIPGRPPWKKNGEFEVPEGLTLGQFHWPREKGFPEQFAAIGINEQNHDFMSKFTMKERADGNMRRRVIDAFTRAVMHDSEMKQEALIRGGWVPLSKVVQIMQKTYEGTDNKLAKNDEFAYMLIYFFMATFRLEFRNKASDLNSSDEGDVRIDYTYLQRLDKTAYHEHSQPIMRAFGHVFKFIGEHIKKNKCPWKTETEYLEACKEATGIDFVHFTTKEICDWMQRQRSYEWTPDKVAWAFVLNFPYDCKLNLFHLIPICSDFPAIDFDFATLKPDTETMSRFYEWKLGSPKPGQSIQSFHSDLVMWKDSTQVGMESEIKRQANAWETVVNTKDTDVDKPPPDQEDDPQAKKAKTDVRDPSKWEDYNSRQWDSHQKPSYNQGDGKQWGAPMSNQTDNANWGDWKHTGTWGPSSSSATDNFKGKGKPQAEPRIGGF